MLPTSNWLSDFIFLIFFCFFAVWVVRRIHDFYTTNGACWLFCFGWRGNSSFKNRIGRVYLFFERHRGGLSQFCSSGIVAWGPVYNLFESLRLWIGFGIGTGCFCSRSCLCYSVCTWNRYVPCSHKFYKKVLDCILVYPVWAWFFLHCGCWSLDSFVAMEECASKFAMLFMVTSAETVILSFNRACRHFVWRLRLFCSHQLLVLVLLLKKVSDFIHCGISFACDTEIILYGIWWLAEQKRVDTLLVFQVKCLFCCFLRCFRNSENDWWWGS